MNSKTIRKHYLTLALTALIAACQGGDGSSNAPSPKAEEQKLTTQQLKDHLTSNSYTANALASSFKVVDASGDSSVYMLENKDSCQGYTGFSNYPKARVLVCDQNGKFIQVKNNEKTVSLPTDYTTSNLQQIMGMSNRNDVAVVLGYTLIKGQLEQKLTDINNGNFTQNQSELFNIFERGNGSGPDTNRTDINFGEYNTEANFQNPTGQSITNSFSLFNTATGEDTGVKVLGTVTNNSIELTPRATGLSNRSIYIKR